MIQLLQAAMTDANWLSNLLNFSVYAVTVAMFVTCIIKCVVPVIHTRRVLNSAIRQLKKGESAKKSWRDDKFLGSGALFPHWSEYLDNLLFADGEFHNPSAVQDYINEDTAIYGPGRASLGEAMPGLMVTMGFLGTLIGISYGLKGFSMEDSEAVMRAIRQLVPGMQYAFTTSIVGAIGAVSATLLTRIVNGSALRALNNFYAALEKHADVKSVDPMTQVAIYQQEQTALIDHLTKDLTGPMTERIAQAIEKSLTPVRRSLDEFMSYTTRDQLRGVDLLVQRFMQAMNDSMGGQFQKLSAIIDSTSKNQLQLQQDLTTAVGALTGMSRDLAQVQQTAEGLFSKFDKYMDKLNGSYQMVDEGYARIAANVEHLEIIARQQNGYLQSVSKLQSEIEKFIENFQGGADQFTKLLGENIEATKTSLEQLTAELKRTSDTMDLSHKKLVGGVNKDIDRSYNAFFENVNKATEQLGISVSDIQRSVEQLPELLGSASDLYAHQADRLEGALRAMQDALYDAVARLG